MAKKHKKKCSVLLGLREMKSKTMKYNYTPARMGKIKDTENTWC